MMKLFFFFECPNSASTIQIITQVFTNSSLLYHPEVLLSVSDINLKTQVLESSSTSLISQKSYPDSPSCTHIPRHSGIAEATNRVLKNAEDLLTASIEY